MKLYLSSYRFGNHPEKLAALVSGSRKALVIPNALDFSQELERKSAGTQREVTAPGPASQPPPCAALIWWMTRA